MKLKKAVYIMAALVLALVFAACGADGEEKAVNEFRELMKQEQDILSQNSALWEKVFMAADKGMTLQELQKVFVEQGCKVAYNLDGGGSATMIMGGERVNKTSGSRERNVSDIVYFTK